MYIKKRAFFMITFLKILLDLLTMFYLKVFPNTAPSSLARVPIFQLLAWREEGKILIVFQHSSFPLKYLNNFTIFRKFIANNFLTVIKMSFFIHFLIVEGTYCISFFRFSNEIFEQFHDFFQTFIPNIFWI